MRLRLSVRAMMLLVAGVSLVLGALAGMFAERKRAEYRHRVESLAWGEADVVERVAERLREAREAEKKGPEGKAEAEAARVEAEWLAELAAWHVKLERTYMRAIERPWEKLPPDPPPPLRPASLGTPPRR